MVAVIEAVVPRSRHNGIMDDEPLFEIIDGRHVELLQRSILASRVASNLLSLMGHHLIDNHLGEASMGMLYRLPLPGNRNRRPDVAYVSAKTIAEADSQPGSDNAWAVLPELMVEVVSPNDIAEEILERIDEYFAAGIKLMWVVYPTQRLIYIYESPRKVRILGGADELDGGVVLPGFRIPLVSLFPA